MAEATGPAAHLHLWCCLCGGRLMLSRSGARLRALPLQRPSPPDWASPWRASRIPLTEAMRGGEATVLEKTKVVALTAIVLRGTLKVPFFS